MPDKQLRCVNCGRPFLWAVADQERYRRRGYEAPKRCKTCLDARKATATAVSARQAPAPLRDSSPPRPRQRRRGRSWPQRTFAVIALVLAALGTGALIFGAGLPLPAAWVVGISVVTFVTYGYDKAIAGAGPTRVPESVLLGLALAGGTLGAVLGMLVFKHKVSGEKAGFRARLVLIIGLQIAAALAWVWFRQA